MTYRRHLTLAAFISLVAFVSCLQGAKAPQVTPVRTLQAELEGPGTLSRKSFGVVFAGPRGKTEDPSEVTVVFNRPMRPLDLAGEESAPPASISPAPKGSWRWMGTSALIFAPDPRLPRATEYTVTVPAGVKALDGSTMATAYSFSFSTPAPRLVRIVPSESDRHLVPAQTFELRFNQPVDPKEVERSAKLLLGDKKAEKSAAFTASWPKPDTRTVIKIAPRAPLPLDTRVVISLEESLRGMEGPLPTGEKKETDYSTYGALQATGTDCSNYTPHKKCAAHGGIRISMSNRVRQQELRAHLRVEPAVKVNWGSSRDNELVFGTAIPARLRPAAHYRITVTAGLKDEYGQVLAKDASFPIDTDDEWPQVEIGLEGRVFEAVRGKTRDIPIASVNAGSYELVTAGLDEAQLTSLLNQKRNWHRVDYEDVRHLGQAKIETIRPGSAPNALSVRPVHLDTVLAAQKGRGAAVVAIKHDARPGSRAHTDARVVSVTDLGITAKMSRFGSLVWVTRLSDGKAAVGARVSVRNASGAEVFSGQTDAGGLCTIAQDKYSPVDSDGRTDPDAILFAKAGDDWTYQRVDESLSSWRYGETSTDTSGRLVPHGMLFTDRGIYKTGESVKVKGIFREPLVKGTMTPRGRAFTLEVFDSSSTKIFDVGGKLGDFGEFSADVPLPASTRLGTVELRADLENGGSANASVEIATYRPAEFKVSVDPDKPSYIRGDKAAFVVRGDYLFGAPMSGGKVHFTVTRGHGYFQPPGAEELVLDDDTYGYGEVDTTSRMGQFQSGDGALDDKGSLPGAVALPMPNQRGAEVVTIEAEVEDVARQTIAGRTSAVVHPGEFYVALKRPKDMFVTKGQNLRPEVAAIEPSGTRRAGVPVRIDLLQRSWHTVVEANGENGSHYDSKPVDTKIGGCDTTTTATGLAACDLPLGEAGYFIVRASGKDARGNAIAASTSIYVIGEGRGIGWAETDVSKIDLVTDKKTYEVGDTAKILVKNPFREAEALITVERAGVYRQQRMMLSGPMPTITIPVSDDLRPNAFVSVHLVRGRVQLARGGTEEKGTSPGGKSQDIGGPAFRLGYAQISINPEARRLKVAVTPARKEYRPGEQVEADVVVTDRAGKGTRGNVTFYAVDEGVLMLTGYKTPDPIPVFTAPRPLAVFSLESRDDMAKLISFAGVMGSDKGDEGGGGGTSVREDFRSTAYFHPSLVTGADGRAHVSFKLPDSLTTYRLMAVVAAEDDRFGFGESQVVTSRPLMARPAMPRFLRAGDSVEAGIVLTSKGLPASSVDVTIAVEGATIVGDAKKVIALPANGNIEVRWPIATATAGQAKFTFRARSGSNGDDVQITREVKVPMSPEAVALYGETSEAIAERLGDLRAMRSDTGGLDLRLSSTALVGLDDGVEQLIQYPYGCTEQLTSRLVPLLPLRDLARDYHIALPPNLDAVVEKTVAKIVQNQASDGGFGWWVDSQQSDAWITAYAMWGLNLAKGKGAHVPDGVIERATSYVRSYLSRPNRIETYDATAAFILDVLAEVGSPDTGYANRLYERREKLPLFARALLAHAMVKSKMSASQAAELTRDFENHLRVTAVGATVVDNLGDAYATIMDSEARTTAMVLRALLAIDPGHPLGARLAKGLLGVRKGGTWRSTQETAWALLSLDDYRHAQESRAPSFDARVFIGEDQVYSAEFRERSATAKTASFSAAKLFASGASGATLAFQVEGTGKLFYEARLRYAKKEMPRDGLDRGFFVRKIVRSVKPDALKDALATLPTASSTTAGAGDLVLVDLLVVTPDPREQVVIDDPLPAGLEAVQANLATSARSLDVTDAGGEGDQADDRASDDDERANDRAYSESWYHREFHDDRVLTFVTHMAAGMYHYRYLARATTIGKYQVPPTRVECMYEPETFGRTGAVTFEVKAR